jgi:2',3'-cyclic-nucleotide 2'-phosphodiesterase
MIVLFIGDVFAEAGRHVVKRFLPALKKKFSPDVVIANAENSAGGKGITPAIFKEFSEQGIHVLTGGNHSFDNKDGYNVLNNEEYVLRPANYPPELPGKGNCIFTLPDGRKLGVVNLMGRTFMDPLDCPFRMADRIVEQIRNQTNCILFDFHAEATSEKVAFGWHLDGRASIVLGTHTHIQTADERILEHGTAFITDVGMTGSYNSVIGVKKEIIVEKYIMKRGRRFEMAKENPWLCGIVVEIDDITGKAHSIERIRVEELNSETHP